MSETKLRTNHLFSCLFASFSPFSLNFNPPVRTMSPRFDWNVLSPCGQTSHPWDRWFSSNKPAVRKNEAIFDRWTAKPWFQREATVSGDRVSTRYRFVRSISVYGNRERLKKLEEGTVGESRRDPWYREFRFPGETKTSYCKSLPMNLIAVVWFVFDVGNGGTLRWRYRGIFGTISIPEMECWIGPLQRTFPSGQV